MIQCYGTMLIFLTLPSDFFMSVVHAAAACTDTARDKYSTVMVVFYFEWLQKCAEVIVRAEQALRWVQDLSSVFSACALYFRRDA